MPTYQLVHGYEAYRDGTRYGPWSAGEVVSLDQADADWVERDSPGCLSKVDAGAADASAPVPALGARPRVNGDPENADVAAAAQERVHAESRERQAIVEPAEQTTDEPAEEAAEEPAVEESTEDDAKKPAKNRAHKTSRNRSA